MFQSASSQRLAVYGSEKTTQGRGVGLWPSGYRGNIVAAEATPVFLKPNKGDRPWGEILKDAKGVVVCGFQDYDHQGDLESLCLWCRQHRFPMLAIDRGLLAMNAAFGGLNYNDLSREMPEALQHRHPPEPGLRHAIVVQPKTLLAHIYGEGEIVVNSEHRGSIQRLANGFRIGAVALDGVIEAVEYEDINDWFALAVQWQPACATASGLDIQVFRAVLHAYNLPAARASTRKSRRLAMAG